MPTPLRDRRRDWSFIVVFSIFALSSTFYDIPVVLDLGPIREIVAETYGKIDRLEVARPPFLATAASLSAFVYGPLYAWFVWGFVRGAAVIRVPALLYAGALSVTMLLIFSEQLYSPSHASPAPATYFAYNGAYFVVPVLLALRMWRPYPFGGDQPG